MATLPSWLDRPNYVGAMQAGAQLGLSIRAQDQAAEQAAIKNQLEQDALNVQQTRYAAQAAEALRNHNALEAYRQRRLEQDQRSAEAIQADREMRRSLDERKLKAYETSLTQRPVRLTPEEADKQWFGREKQRYDYQSRLAEISDARKQASSASKALSDFVSDSSNSLLIGAGEPGVLKTKAELESKAIEAKSLLDSLVKGQDNSTMILPSPSSTNSPPTITRTPSGSTGDSFRNVERIRVRSKSGKIGTVSSSKLEEALKEGYTLLE